MTALPDSASRSLFKNASAQIAGRLLLSLGRLGAAMLIVRYAGAERFGEYALVINFIVLFEWLTDFGQTDIAVRKLCQEPEAEAEGPTLRALAALKLAQGLLLGGVLPLLVYLMDYPAEIVGAAAIGGVGLVFYAVTLVYRTVFRVRMTMERDVASELGGLAVMLPLTWYACTTQAGVGVLVACYVASRVVFFMLTALLGGAPSRAFRLPVHRADLLELLRHGLPLGVAGLLVSVYDSLATIMLSKLADMHAVAQYAAATRYVFPVIIVVQAMNTAFYPPLSALWKTSPPQFARLQQTGLEVSLLVGAGLFCGVYSGADFLMRLIGVSGGDAALILQLMSWVVLARAVTTAMSPLIVIAGRQAKALWLSVTAVLLQVAALAVLVPHYGGVGAVLSYLAIELLVGVLPVSLIGQRATGFRAQLSVPARLLGSAVLAVAICSVLPFAGSMWAGMLGFVLYLAFVVLSGAVSPRKLQALAVDILDTRRRAAGVPAVGVK